MEYNWHKILHDMTRRVQSSVHEAMQLKGTIPTYKYKQLLDKQAQDAIIDSLRTLDISAQLVSEEGDRWFYDADYTFTVDPVDGTTNLSRGFQPAVTSISVATEPFQSKVFAGIIVDLYNGQTYYAEKGAGATLDGQPLAAAPYVEYSRGLISLDLSKMPTLDRIYDLITRSRHIRSEGCSAKSLCYLAEGALDAHVDLRGIVRATDISAGLLILQEAGAVYSLNGEPGTDMSLTRTTHTELLAASSLRLLNEIQSLIP